MLKRVLWCNVLLLVLIVLVIMQSSQRQPSSSPVRDTEGNSSARSLPSPSLSMAIHGHRGTVSPPHMKLFDNRVLRKTEQVLNSSWAVKLKDMLGETKKLVSIVFTNTAYLESAINWLIAAKVRLNPPLNDVIVICLDRRAFDILSTMDIPSIYIDRQTVVNLNLLHDKFNIIFITRLVVYRLINYFGHDVMAYDSDAIVLKNPRELFDAHQDSDIITSVGKFPNVFSRVWGFTACMGAILFRSTPRTELFWELIDTKYSDDQLLINRAFNNCHIQWQSNDKSIGRDSIDGQCTNGLRVTALPYGNICRYQCIIDLKLYVWHLMTPKKNIDKVATAKENGLWFLKSNWVPTIRDSLRGTRWLNSIYKS